MVNYFLIQSKLSSIILYLAMKYTCFQAFSASNALFSIHYRIRKTFLIRSHFYCICRTYRVARCTTTAVFAAYIQLRKITLTFDEVFSLSSHSNSILTNLYIGISRRCVRCIQVGSYQILFFICWL